MEDIVDDSQRLIALCDRIYDDPDGADIVDLAEGQVLALHLAVDAVDVLGPALNLGLQPFTGEVLLDVGDGALHVRFAVGAAFVNLHGDLALVSDPPAQNTLSAYRVLFRGPQQQLISTNFYADPAATRWPYLYIPVPDYTPGQQIRLYFRDLNGNTSEFSKVQAFSEVPDYEYLMAGNCAVCFIDKPGLFYITGAAGKRGY